MAANDPALRRAVAAAGGAARTGRADAEKRRADLAADRLEAHIRKVVAAAPPLSEAQRARLARLFREDVRVMPGSPAPGADSATTAGAA